MRSSSARERRARGAGAFVPGALLLLIMALTAACSSRERPLLVVDTVSGANFQWFFKRQAVPRASGKLGVEIDYIVSSGPEMIERMKAWRGGTPQVDVLLLKPMDLAAAFDAGIPLARVGPDAIARASLIEGLARERVLGRDLAYRAVPLWRSRTGLIYNAKYIARPPLSWKELRERAGEWHGRIGVIRPDAKSSGGRGFVYGFLAACGVDLTLPLDSLDATREWKEAWRELAGFARHVKMPMGEAPFLFQQFKKEEVWLSVYSIDYVLWARDQGFLPPELAVAFFEEGMPAGSDAYAAVPGGLPESRESLAFSFVEFLLSEEMQMLLLREMNQYPSVRLPPDALSPEEGPSWEKVRGRRVELLGKEAMDYIREEATGFMIAAGKGGT